MPVRSRGFTAIEKVAALELLGMTDGARCREQPPGGAPRQLDVSSPDGSFSAIGAFTQITNPFSSTSHHLAIYIGGVPGANAWELANVMTPADSQIDIDP